MLPSDTAWYQVSRNVDEEQHELTQTGTRARGSPIMTGQLPGHMHGVWSVDADQSHARFTAATLAGLVKTPGRFRALSGGLTIEPAGASGALTIDATSIDTGNGLRDRHLRSRDFFGVAKHPELRYELHGLTPAGEDRLRLEGQLTIAGARTALPLDAELLIHADTTIEICARTEVDRVALGVRGAPGMVPRAVNVDVRVVLRRGEP
jgi:polyisoprenoid-binding protein YceI